ncbi:MAG: M20/M25/M40 family metallo-hydrolase [Spirochaetes bacterium]|nr:M20/M25/M40 family metallo-hydrolase [Spirochaetota bacterium]
MNNEQLNEVLNIFSQISKIPRCSKNEERIAKYLINFALENNLEYKIDNHNNVLIKIPPTNGYENLPGIIIQTHMDMVCEKDNDIVHDFNKDPIELIFEGDFLKAKGTTLGADDGIGMSIALSYAKMKNLPHPPLELLFTVDEETGLTGAKMLSEDFLSYNYMLNIDTDSDKTFIIGCAGGKDVKVKIKTYFSKLTNNNLENSIRKFISNYNFKNSETQLQNNKNLNFSIFELNIDGLIGGHSGLDINKKRGNAIIILIRLLNYLLESNILLCLVSIFGGQAHNAIPRSSKATIVIPEIYEKEFLEKIKIFSELLISEIKFDEPNIKILFEKINDRIDKNKVEELFFIDFQETKKIINLLNLIPHGVFTMSSQIPNLVESSNNFAKINTNFNESSFDLLLSYRSSNDSVMAWAISKIKSLSEILNFNIEIGNGYPSWTPDIDSKFLYFCKESYKECFSEYPKVDVIHAGLECGILKSKYKNLEVISCGVELHSPHSPQEKVSISSIERTLKFINKLFSNWKNFFN